MQFLAAQSIGSKVPSGNFQGVVSGVYDQTFNIQLTDQSLLTCASDTYFNMPRGVLFNSLGNNSFNTLVSVGSTAHCRGSILRISKNHLKIDLRSASIWSPVFKHISSPSKIKLSDLITDIRDDLQPVYENLINSPILEVRQLIGRGVGLTPEGDDILAGFLAGFHQASDSQLLQSLRSEIQKRAIKTTDVSRQMLLDASEGHFIEPIVNFISALYGVGNLKIATHNLISVGSSSGPAMILGAVAAVTMKEKYILASNSTQFKAA
jgi:hypothetical protein